jgi:hypothetical protein
LAAISCPLVAHHNWRAFRMLRRKILPEGRRYSMGIHHRQNVLRDYIGRRAESSA